MVYRYRIVLRHGGGTIAVVTTASGMAPAITQVCRFEGAPESSVVEAVCLGEVA